MTLLLSTVLVVIRPGSCASLCVTIGYRLLPPRGAQRVCRWQRRSCEASKPQIYEATEVVHDVADLSTGSDRHAA